MRSTSSLRRSLLDTGNIFLVLCVVLFVVFLVNTYDMEEASSYLLPRMVCVFGLVVGSIKLVASCLGPRERDIDNGEGESGAGVPVAYSIAFVAIYFLATPWLGFILSTATAILAFSYLMRFPRKGLAVVLSIAIPVTLHLTFVTLLRASLPAGIIENLLF